MSENKKKILEMLAENKITVEEAERLLALTVPEEAGGNTDSEPLTEKKKAFKYLRVEVTPGKDWESHPHGERVNVRVPMNLIRAGMKLTSLIPAHAADKVNDALKEKGVDFDMRSLKPEHLEDLVDALSDLEVNVESGKEKIHVYVE